MDCVPGKKGSRKIEVGKKPPEGSEVIARSIPVPLPSGNMTTARLERWY
jgi:hypothetical protein